MPSDTVGRPLLSVGFGCLGVLALGCQWGRTLKFCPMALGPVPTWGWESAQDLKRIPDPQPSACVPVSTADV